MTTEPELLPCPWHGDSTDLEVTDNGSRTYWVVCNRRNCGCEGPWASSEAEAIAAWNRREAATALSEAKAENERLREALKPFAGDKLPSTKPSVIDYNRHGLRCMMSPMEVAQTAAYRALNPKGGDNGEA